jgi:hypothetical protein
MHTEYVFRKWCVGFCGTGTRRHDSPSIWMMSIDLTIESPDLTASWSINVGSESVLFEEVYSRHYADVSAMDLS